MVLGHPRAIECSMSAKSKQKAESSTRRFALRVEVDRLQLVIATPGADGVYTISIDEAVCKDPAGWVRFHDSGPLEDALHELLSRHQVRRQSIAVSLDSSFCVTRVAMGPSEAVDRELEMLHSRVPRYLQLGPGEKVTGCSRTRLAPGIEHVVMGVVNLQSLETIYDALCGAEAKVAWIEPSLVSVARLVGAANLADEPILLADGSGSQWDIGIAYQGKLLLDYRPAGANGDDALSAALDGHISRLRRFCHRHRGITSSELNKLYIYGENEKLSRTTARLDDRIGIEATTLEVPTIDSVYRIEHEFHSTKYVPAVAAMFPLLTNVSIDEVPDMLGRIRRAPDRPWPIRMTITIWPVVAALLFLVISYGLVSTERRRALAVIESRAQIETQMTQTQLRLTQLTGQRELLAHLERISDATRETGWDQVLTQVSQCLPDNVRINEFRVESDGQVRLEGVTNDEATVYDVVGHLRHLPEIIQVALQGTAPEPQSDATRFTVRLTTANGQIPELVN